MASVDQPNDSQLRPLKPKRGRPKGSGRYRHGFSDPQFRIDRDRAIQRLQGSGFPRPTDTQIAAEMGMAYGHFRRFDQAAPLHSLTRSPGPDEAESPVIIVPAIVEQ